MKPIRFIKDMTRSTHYIVPIDYEHQNLEGEYSPSDKISKLVEALERLDACFNEFGELDEKYQDQLSMALEKSEQALKEFNETKN